MTTQQDYLIDGVYLVVMTHIMGSECSEYRL